ncbi:hypothetical protein FHW12_003125 [Dokdonella fugitiva]|uniref:Uncharacterized protein n=1 Tax=Dokdonella fugitiva TaxID=328517 RepID=A0A839F500_9GAMM|nr:hypothetical protein [Dokdonella fugitiva]MBA8888889.1 hypothetical protein [Dokdonella fugitiva]
MIEPEIMALVEALADKAAREYLAELAAKHEAAEGARMSLAKMIAAYEESERAIHPLFDDAECPASDRARFAASLLAQVHEHAISIRLLLAMPSPGNRFGTACALMRPILEGLVRGLWILDCATDDQVQERIANDDDAWRPGLGVMSEAVDAALHTDGFYRGLHNRFYNAMCSYTHGGMRVVNNNLTGEAIEPTSTLKEWAAVVSFAHAMDLLATHASLSICSKDEDAQRVLLRAEEVIAAKLDSGV